MSDRKINMVKFDKRKSPVTQLGSMIKEAFEIFKGDELLIVNRKAKGDFLDVFADSLYEYERGVVLLERFYKKDKCMNKGSKYREISKENKDLIKEFIDFSKNIPASETLAEKERKEYTDKLKSYTDRVSTIDTELSVLKTFKYNNFILAEFDSLEDETLEIMSNLYAGMGLNFLSCITWSSLNDVSIAITTIEHDDYIDLILLPINEKNED